MIATANGGYESASDYDDETLALITSEEHSGDDSNHETQYMAPEDADRYECLVAQRVLSMQVTQAESLCLLLNISFSLIIFLPSN